MKTFKIPLITVISQIIVFILIGIAAIANISYEAAYILDIWAIVIGLGGLTWILIDKILRW